jgi:hypothetical protein
MWPDALVVDLLRPSGALHTIVVKPKTHDDYVIVADITDAPPPDSAGHTPVDVGSLRLLNAEGIDVSVFRSRPRKFAQRASSSVYDVYIKHTATPMQQGVYYLGFPPEWSVCSVRIAQTAAAGTRRAWGGLHSHVDDSSWIELPFSSASASRESLAISVSVDSDPAHGVSRLPEFSALHHRHAPVEIMRPAAHGAEPIASQRAGRSLVDAVEVKPGAFGVRIDLRAVSRSLSGGAAERTAGLPRPALNEAPPRE